MSVFVKNIIRCAVDITKQTGFVDVNTLASPSSWAGNEIQLQFGFFIGSGAGVVAADLTGWNSFGIEILGSDRRTVLVNTFTATPSAPTITLSNWTDGTAQHLIVDVGTTAMSSLTIPPGAISAQYWLVVYGTNTDGKVMTLGASSYILSQAGYASVTPSAIGGNLIPNNDSYNGSGAYTLALTAGMSYTWVQGVNDTNVVHDSVTTTASNTTFALTGASVVLHGTASQPVTAAIIASPVITTASVAALLTSYVPARSDTVGANFRFKDSQLQIFDATLSSPNQWRAIGIADGQLIISDAIAN